MEVRDIFRYPVRFAAEMLVHSSEGIQVGNVRSKFGVLGSWTTVLHDRQDPVGTCLAPD